MLFVCVLKNIPHRGLAMRPALLAFCLFAPTLPAQPQGVAAHWTGSWAASQQIPEPANALAPADLTDATLRQIVHLSCGGTALRIHLSNAFGTAPLTLTDVHIAQPRSRTEGTIEPATDHALLFAGQPTVTIPAGADYLSDPLPLAVAPLSDLAVTFHLATAPSTQTGHPGSRATSFLAHATPSSAPALPAAAKHFDHWTMLSGVDVLTPAAAPAIVILGDSITDGHGAPTNANQRWPDILAARLNTAPHTPTGVLNQGIGGNHLLTDGLGPNALARLDRDVLAQTGVTTVIVLEGVNDLGMLARANDPDPTHHTALVHAIEAAYTQIIARAHAHNLRVLGCTILPYLGSDYYHPSPTDEADRQLVNTFIRDPRNFDAVIDFDRLTTDPAHPGHLLSAFDSGDHLHPSPVGYKVMAESIPLTLLTR